MPEMTRTDPPGGTRGRVRGPIAAALVPLALVACLTGCGESKEQKAEKKVCSAKSDISSRITSLKSLPLAASSLEQAKADVTAISEDLKQMKEAAPDLAEPRKQEVQKATEQFGKEANEATAGLKSGGSVTAAQSQLTAALQKLSSAYSTALEPIKCS